MSTALVTLLNASVTTGTGTEHDLSALPLHCGGSYSFEITGTFVGTGTIEARLDSAWVVLETFSAPGFLNLPGCFAGLRASVTVYTSGAVTVKVRYGLQDDGATQTLLTRLTATRAGYLDALLTLPEDVATLLGRLSAARAGYLDGLPSLDADLLTLLSRLSALRAAYLDELGPTAAPADIDALLARLSGARGALLDNLSRLDVLVSSLNMVDALNGVRKSLRSRGLA